MSDVSVYRWIFGQRFVSVRAMYLCAGRVPDSAAALVECGELQIRAVDACGKATAADLLTLSDQLVQDRLRDLCSVRQRPAVQSEASAVEPAMWWKGAAGGDEPAFRGRHKARKLGWAESAESGLCGPRSVASAVGCVVESLGGLGPELQRRALQTATNLHFEQPALLGSPLGCCGRACRII